MAKKKNSNLIKQVEPSTIISIKMKCGSCGDIHDVIDATFEADATSGRTCGGCRSKESGFYTCMCSPGGVDNKRVCFQCPSCNYYSTIYIGA